MTSDNDNQPRLVSLNDACKLTSLSRTSINRLRTVGLFPQAVPLGEKRVAFVRSEVEAWIKERIAGRRQLESKALVREARAIWGSEAAHQLEEKLASRAAA